MRIYYKICNRLQIFILKEKFDEDQNLLYYNFF